MTFRDLNFFLAGWTGGVVALSLLIWLGAP